MYSIRKSMASLVIKNTLIRFIYTRTLRANVIDHTLLHGPAVYIEQQYA